MARTHVEKYSSASTTKSNNPLNESTNKMPSVNKYSDGSTSTHSSCDNPGRRTKVATSMRKFLSEDDNFDYLGSITSKGKTPSGRSKSSPVSAARKKVSSSYRKPKIAEVRERDSRHRRPTVPQTPRSPRARANNKGKPRSVSKRAKNSNRDVYEGSLNDTKPRESAQSLMASARKLLDKAARAASPGRLRGDRSDSRSSNSRSNSPGPHKTRKGFEGKNPGSPTSNSTAPSSGDRGSPSPPSSPKRKPRTKSPGRLKKRDKSEERQRSTRSKKRSESPGRLKKRSQSPGKLKKRSQSPGALRKSARPRRRPENGEGRRRASSSGPLKKPERARSHDRKPASRARRDNNRPIRSTRSDDGSALDGKEGDAPVKENESYSNMQHELNRYKVKRNKSMDAMMTHRARKNASEVIDDDDDSRRPPRRAESMMLSREIGRRGKSNSLADLVQYKEEEIHSTSYFASNHVLVNRERMKRGLRPLTRNVPMDQLARKCSETMAESSGIQALPTTYVGNVLRGENIRAIHRSTMLQKQGRERANILNPYFQDFGVGTCKGKDGMLYMCQLFSERLEIRLTDTTNDDEDKSE